MNITEFLLARVAEDEVSAGDWHETYCGWCLREGPGFDDDGCQCGLPARVLAECEAKRAIIKFHRSWPTLVETRPEMPEYPALDSIDVVTFRMEKRIQWMTEQEYIARFGIDPPTSPIMRALAAVYADHPDYREEWS